MMKNVLTMLSVNILCAGVVFDAGAAAVTVVKPLAGYVCVNLNVSDDQLNDDKFIVPVYGKPETGALQAGVASALMIAKSPIVPVNGFDELLFPTGQTVWIADRFLRPFINRSNPSARCIPSLLSNGKPGFG